MRIATASRLTVSSATALAAALVFSPAARADAAPATAPSAPPAIEWIDGPGDGALGEYAHITVPEGFRFTGAKGTRMLLEAMHNPSSEGDIGLLVPKDMEDGKDWFVVFSFDETGYVKDDEKSELDAAAMMKSMKENTKEGNEARKQRGWEPIELVGWQIEPFYNEQTHNLEWATLLKGQDGSTSINYSTRLLGRRGVMRVALVLGPDQLTAVGPAYQDLLKGFSYKGGETYAEFRKGDKVAEYGLIALVAGGAGAVAAKTGLLAKFWKLIVVGVAGAAGAVKKFFAKLSRRGEETIPGPDPTV